MVVAVLVVGLTVVDLACDVLTTADPAHRQNATQEVRYPTEFILSISIYLLHNRVACSIGLGKITKLINLTVDR